MITPTFSPTATERVLPKLALDFTTAVLDGRVTVTRALNTATRINSSGYIEAVNANLPRFDYSPTSIGTCRGILIEEARTNLLLYSSDFSNPAWAKTNITATPNAILAPDGTVTAYKLEATGSASVIQTVTATATSHTYTIFAKQGSAANQGARFLLRNGTTATNLLGVLVDYSNGSFIYTVGSSGATVEAYPNGWWKITLVVTTGIAVGNSILAYVGFSGTGAAGQFLYAWGAQLEAGAFATSYIPTTTTSLTRNADQVVLTGANFTSWYQTGAGTLFTEASQPVIFAASRVSASLAASANNPRISTYRQSAGNLQGFIINAAGTANAVGSGVPAVANTVHRTVLSYSATDVQTISANASTPGSISGIDMSTSFASFTSLVIGADFNTSTNAWCGHIRKVMWWPQKLTDREVQAFSK